MAKPLPTDNPPQDDYTGAPSALLDPSLAEYDPHGTAGPLKAAVGGYKMASAGGGSAANGNAPYTGIALPAGVPLDLKNFKEYQERVLKDRSDVDTAAERVARAENSPDLTAPPPRQQPTDLFQAFGQPAFLLAAIGGLLSRNHLTNAINAGAAAIKSSGDQDQTIYKQNYEAWKLHTENAMKTVKFTQDAYAAAMQKMKTDVEGGKAEFETKVAAYKDAVLDQMIKVGDWEGVKRVLFARQLGLDQMANASIALQEHQLDLEKKRQDQADNNAVIEADTLAHPGLSLVERHARDALIRKGQDPDAAHGANATWVNVDVKNPDGSLKEQLRMRTGADNKPEYQHMDGSPAEAPAGQIGKTGTSKAPEQSKLTGPALDKAAEFYHATHQLPPGFGGQPDRDAIQNREAQLYPNTSGGGFATQAATYKADSSSLQAVTKLADAATGQERAAKKEFDLAASLLPKTPEPLDSQLLTSWVRTGSTQFGGTAAPKYMASLVSGLDEYAKILAGATGAAGSTDAARTQAASLIPYGATTEQVKGIIDVLKQGMTFKQQSYQDQINDIKTRMTGGDAAYHADVPVISDKAAYDALPSGSKYRKETDAPNQVRTKP